MRFAPTEEQVAFGSAIADLLAAESPVEVVRAAWDAGDDTALRRLWRHLGDSGLLALLVPEDAGGLGLDAATLAPVLQRIGYAATPGPVTDTVTIAAPLLAAGDHPAVADVLAGQLLVACGTGRAGPVPHAQVADLFVLDGPHGPVCLSRSEVEVTPVTSIDGARQLGHVTIRGDGHPLPVADDATRLATLGTSAELVGLAQRMLDMTVAYVQQREQFGRPVGAFQAVKHQLADSLSQVAFARPAVARAGATLAAGWASADRDVAVAKATATEAAAFVAKRAIQCHGAIAYTVEYDLHLFAKRAWALTADRGDAADHRRRVARDLDIPV